MRLKQIKVVSLLGFLLFILAACVGVGSSPPEQGLGPNNSAVIWRDDFEDGDMVGWTIHDYPDHEISNWYVEAGYLIQQSNIGKGKLGTQAVAGQADWTDYTLSANVVSTDDDYIGVLFRYQDPENYYRFSLSSQISKIRLEKRVDGVFETIGFLEEMWPECRFNISVDVRGDSIKVYLDQMEYFSIVDTSLSWGKVGFATYHNNASFFNDITVYDNLKITRNKSLYFDRVPYLQNVLGDSAVIMWGSSQAQNSQVEYGLSRGETQTILMDDRVKIHEVVLPDLQQGQQYTYRVSSGSLVSDWYIFRTAKTTEQAFRFALYGDNRTNFLRHSEVVSAISAQTPDFIINTGDVVMNGLRPDWDTELFDPLQDLLTSTPIYVSVGNHENNTLGTTSPDQEQIPYSHYFSKYFSFPDKPHETYYSFEYGNAFFIFFDNNLAAYTDRAFPDIASGSSQHQWLEKQLSSPAAQNAEWLFVTAHIPIMSKVRYKLNEDQIWPLFKKYGVDFYFSGHVHDYERSYVDGIYHIISGGGGGPQDHPVRNQADIRKQRTSYHYCLIDINGSTLDLSFRDREQRVMDQVVIDKRFSNSHKDLSIPKKLTLKSEPGSPGVPVIFELSLPLDGEFNISIYNDKGDIIKYLVDRYAPAGTYWLNWVGDDADGFIVPNGNYICKVNTGTEQAQTQIILQN